MQNYYQKEIETASPEQIRAWQDERLVKTVHHVWDNVEFYRKRMEEAGVTPDDIQGVKDLHKLPFIIAAAVLVAALVLFLVLRGGGSSERDKRADRPERIGEASGVGQHHPREGI